MNEIILVCYEFATSCLPGTIVAALLLRQARRKPTRREAAAAALLIAYTASMLHVTGAGTLHDGLRRGIPQFGHCNFIPFSNGASLTQCLLNVVLFIPFGCFLGAEIDKRSAANMFAKHPMDAQVTLSERLTKAALGGFAFSLVIEASQLLTNRVFDVDDLIMNTLGACAGCAAVSAIARTAHSGNAVENCRQNAVVTEAFANWIRGIAPNERGWQPDNMTPNKRDKQPDEMTTCDRRGKMSGIVAWDRKGRTCETADHQNGQTHETLLVGAIAATFLGRFLFFDEMGMVAALYRL